jgi:hypothetical protein
MKLLRIMAILATLLTSILALSSLGAQKTGAEVIEAENVENICRPRLSKRPFTTLIVKTV